MHRHEHHSTTNVIRLLKLCLYSKADTKYYTALEVHEYNKSVYYQNTLGGLWTFLSTVLKWRNCAYERLAKKLVLSWLELFADSKVCSPKNQRMQWYSIAYGWQKSRLEGFARQAFLQLVVKVVVCEAKEPKFHSRSLSKYFFLTLSIRWWRKKTCLSEIVHCQCTQMGIKINLGCAAWSDIKLKNSLRKIFGWKKLVKRNLTLSSNRAI